MVKESRILVLGDSYANFSRFESGIKEAFAASGRNAATISVSLPGADSAKIARFLGDRVKSQAVWAGAPYTAVVLIAGINDIAKRRGTRAFAKSMSALMRHAQKLTVNLFALEIINFDETVIISSKLGQARSALYGLVFDRRPGRIARYRETAAGMDGLGILRTHDFMPHYRPACFKDGVHLTDAEFPKLARHVGGQLANIIA